MEELSKKQLELSESKIITSICSYLQYLENMNKLIFIRNNTGCFINPKGNFYRMGKTGSPDILIFLTTNNKFATIGLEVKNFTGKQSNSQKEFQKKFEIIGGIYFLIRSLNETEKIINYAFKKDLYKLPKDFLCKTKPL